MNRIRQRDERKTIEPLNGYVLIRKDADKDMTKGGIALPQTVKLKSRTGVIIGMAPDVERQLDRTGNPRFNLYDRVVVNTSRVIRVDPENSHLFLVPVVDLAAKINRR